jgi:hypothetical protein
VFSLVEGLIVQLLTSNPKREKWAAGTPVAVVGELANRSPAADNISSVLASSSAIWT